MSEPPARCHAQGLVGASSAAAAALAICMLPKGCGLRGGEGRDIVFIIHCICNSLIKEINNIYIENSRASSQDLHLFHVTYQPKALNSEVAVLIRVCTHYWSPVVTFYSCLRLKVLASWILSAQ